MLRRSNTFFRDVMVIGTETRGRVALKVTLFRRICGCELSRWGSAPVRQEGFPSHLRHHLAPLC